MNENRLSNDRAREAKTMPLHFITPEKPVSCPKLRRDFECGMVRKAELGKADLAQFPMLCHAAAVLDKGKDAELPWELFTFDETN